MALYRLPILILLMSLIYLFVLPENPASFKFIFQFVPMVLIILHAFRLLPRNKSKAHYFILAGLGISFFGNATSPWLMISMIVFILVHLCYTLGFFAAKTEKKIPFLPVIIPIILYTGTFSAILAQAFVKTDQGNLIFLSIFSIIIISIMLWSAINTRNNFAISGSLLFVVAHSILFWNLFIQPINDVEPIVMLTYYGAQFLIATSLDNIVRGAKSIVW